MKQYFLNPVIMRYLCIILVLFMGINNAHATAQQQFADALNALKSKNLSDFHQLSANLQNYPLHYYLRYKYLKPRLKQVSSSEIQKFVTRYGNSYFGNLIHRNWLNQLVKERDWETFVQFYTPQKSTSLQCYYIHARLLTTQNVQAALRDAKKLWLTGKSQPKSCNMPFKHLYENGLVNDALIWERIGLAMAKSNLGLASSLAKRLDSDAISWVKRWKTMHKRPARTLANFAQPDLPIVREIIKHGIKRLARKRFKLANEYWETLQHDYAFSIDQIGEVQRTLALASIKRKHPQALKWLAAVNKNYLNAKFNKIRIGYVLERQDWYAVADFITQLSDEERNVYKWRYWLARALEKTDRRTQAKQIYKKLANERDYYGFLAAERINTRYKMRHNPIVFTPTERANLLKNTAIAGAHEFYQLSKQLGSKHEWLLNARREWEYAIKVLPARQKIVAAALANRWGWHDRALMTASKAGYYDDLDVRFPLAFYKQLAAGAKRQYLDLAWVYGVVRQESAFMSKARSHAGALGLMQLMPATGRLMARKLGLRLNRTKDILDIDTNVSLGTAYLRQMLDKFDGNYMLATAAYNAGPGRAKRWAANNACTPSDLWVEMIPFKETRKYVQRVLFYSSVFSARLENKHRPMGVTLAPYESCQFNYRLSEK